MKKTGISKKENPLTESVDWTSLDKVTTFHVNSNVNQAFTNVAERQGFTRASLLRRLMLLYVQEHSNEKN